MTTKAMTTEKEEKKMNSFSNNISDVSKNQNLTTENKWRKTMKRKDAVVKKVTFGLNENRESVRLEWVDGKILVMNGKNEIKPAELLNFKKYDLYPYIGEKSCIWQRLGDQRKVKLVETITKVNTVADKVISMEAYKPIEEEIWRLEEASYYEIWDMVDLRDPMHYDEIYGISAAEEIAGIEERAQVLLDSKRM